MNSSIAYFLNNNATEEEMRRSGPSAVLVQQGSRAAPRQEIMVSGVQVLSMIAMAVGGIALPDCIEHWDSWHGYSCNQTEPRQEFMQQFHKLFQHVSTCFKYERAAALVPPTPYWEWVQTLFKVVFLSWRDGSLESLGGM